MLGPWDPVVPELLGLLEIRVKGDYGWLKVRNLEILRVFQSQKRVRRTVFSSRCCPSRIDVRPY